MATKRLEPALLEIDPGDRALLALALHRGMADEEVADLLGAAPEDVVRRRASALGAVAGAAGLGAERAGGDLEAELRALPPEAWREGGGGTSEPPPRKRPAGRLAVAALALVAAIAVPIAVSSGGSEPDSQAPSASGDASGPGAGTGAGDGESGSGGEGGAGSQRARPVALKPLPGAGTKGVVTASASGGEPGSRLTIRLRGLPNPKGRYVAWLYDSLIDSRALGTSASGDGTIRATLAADGSMFRFLDLSWQPRGWENHSGISVRRIPLRRVLRPADAG